MIIGGFNTWIHERRFVPNSADSPLVSDDIDAIRRHYGLQCDKESKFTNWKPTKMTIIMFVERVN